MQRIEERLEQLEPRLLCLFDLIYSTGSVTRAGAIMGQNQPTVSVWLSKLRAALNDPLFVRTSKGMLPTPRAESLITTVRAALNYLRQIVVEPIAFDPTVAKRQFRLCMTDADDITMLKDILDYLLVTAPGVTLETTRIDGDVGDKLTSGEVDLALGLVPELDAGFYQQTLYTDDWVCLCSSSHPVANKTLTVEDYSRELHVSVATRTGEVLCAAIERQEVRYRVALELPGYLSLPRILVGSRLLSTVPRRIGRELASNSDLVTVACPILAPRIEVKQYWHTRYQHDPANIWIRSVCMGLFGSKNECVDRRRMPPNLKLVSGA